MLARRVVAFSQRIALCSSLSVFPLAACSSDDTPASQDAGVSGEMDGGGDPGRDSDGDGIPDSVERPGGRDRDSDGDGIPDHLDDDDDGDGIPTKDEGLDDTDGDGIPDYRDADDDGDGIPTKDELAGGVRDSDGDGIPDHLDSDAIDAGPPPQCAQTSGEADLQLRPVDIIFVIDNSGSMAGEIQAVQSSINADFAEIIGGSKIDYRVIMLGDFGYHDTQNAKSVCISGDLNPGQSCPADSADAVYGMAPVHNAPRYFHYDPDGPTHERDNAVASRNSLCRTLEWYDTADGFAQAPEGFRTWLRKDALKVFVEITDDRADCAADLDGDGTDDIDIDDRDDDPSDPMDVPGEWQAKTFDALLRAQDPEQFGTEAARNYVWHSIISIPDKAAPNADQPYTPDEAIQSGNCSSGEHPGSGYEALSRMTGGLRFPICAADSAAGTGNLAGFTAVFQKIAEGVVQGSKIECDLPIPMPPKGETLDRSTVEVVYTESSGSTEVSFREVSGQNKCSTNDAGFYFDGDAIVLCPSTCTRVQADPSAKVDIRFGCELPKPMPTLPQNPD